MPMKFIEYAKIVGYDDEWIEHNVDGLFDTNAEMVRTPEFDDHSDAYMVDGCLYHVCHSSSDVVIIGSDDDGVKEEYILD